MSKRQKQAIGGVARGLVFTVVCLFFYRALFVDGPNQPEAPGRYF